MLKYGPSATKAPVDTPKPEGVPPYPSQLRAVGKKAWDAYWTAGKAWLSDTDFETIRELCEIHDEEERLRRVIEKEGLTEQTIAPRFLSNPMTHEMLVEAVVAAFDPEDVDAKAAAMDAADTKANSITRKLYAIARATGDTKSTLHPLWKQWQDLRGRKLPLWIDAHMTPSSRGKANVQKAEADPLADWEANRG